MKLILNHAENALLEEAGNVHLTQKRGLAMHFCLSQALEKYRNQEYVKIITTVVASRLKAENVTIYVCRDGDLIITGSNLLPGMEQNVVADVRQMTSDDPLTQDDMKIYNRYVFPEEELDFLTFCQNKFTDSKANRSQTVIEAAEPSALEFNDDLFLQAYWRRNDRINLQILVVEDQAFSRRLVALALGDKHEVLCAATAHEALDIYIRNAPNIVFLDNGLPDEKGQNLLRLITHHDRDAYIVMLTADADIINIQQARDNGVRGYIAKPFTRQKLSETIDRYKKFRSSR